MEGNGIRSHQRNINEKVSNNIRIILQPAGMAEKVRTKHCVLSDSQWGVPV